MDSPEMEELLRITQEGFAGLNARIGSLESEVDSLQSLHGSVDSLSRNVDSLHGSVGSLHARFDAFGEGLLFVARKVLAEPEVRELRRILNSAPAEARRSA